MRNVILTGLPRSGTSLACRLLNQLDDVVALQEPMHVETFGTLRSWDAIGPEIAAFFMAMRRSALERGEVVSQQVGGQIADNFFQLPGVAPGQRRRIAERGPVRLNKPVTPALTLVIKHNAAFAALLDRLSGEYPAFALIRHPLWALASWNSNDLPIYHGHVPMAEQLDPALAHALQTIPDRIDRQIHILNWMFGRFSLLPPGQVIRYEEMVRHPGLALRAIAPAAATFHEELVNTNLSQRYPRAPLAELRERLVRAGGLFLDYYPENALTLP